MMEALHTNGFEWAAIQSGEVKEHDNDGTKHCSDDLRQQCCSRFGIRRQELPVARLIVVRGKAVAELMCLQETRSVNAWCYKEVSC